MATNAASLESTENAESEEEAADNNNVEIDIENVKMARKILKRRLHGLDVPFKCWLSFGLENQKRYLKS